MLEELHPSPDSEQKIRLSGTERPPRNTSSRLRTSGSPAWSAKGSRSHERHVRMLVEITEKTRRKGNLKEEHSASDQPIGCSGLLLLRKFVRNHKKEP